jgi:hypothetical protein
LSLLLVLEVVVGLAKCPSTACDGSRVAKKAARETEKKKADEPERQLETDIELDEDNSWSKYMTQETMCEFEGHVGPTRNIMDSERSLTCCCNFIGMLTDLL